MLSVWYIYRELLLSGDVNVNTSMVLCIARKYFLSPIPDPKVGLSSGVLTAGWPIAHHNDVGPSICSLAHTSVVNAMVLSSHEVAKLEPHLDFQGGAHPQSTANHRVLGTKNAYLVPMVYRERDTRPGHSHI